MVNLDDFEDDFDGALDALIKETIAKMEAVPEAERAEFYLRGKAEHFARLLEFRAPAFLIRRAEVLLLRALFKRRRARLAARVRSDQP